jgi:aminopeptidase N
MKTQEPRTIYLKDYRPAPYLIEETELDIRLHPTQTRIASRLKMRPNPAAKGKREPLVLDGEKLKLIDVAIDGQALPAAAFELGETGLTIFDPPGAPFMLEVTNLCDPEANTALSGLYLAGRLYCTQCEPEGFRRITYFLDRPDVLAKFRVRVEGDAKDMPVLLSNGNLIEAGRLFGGRHYAVWDDPFPKPSYLFALVGGKLGHISDSFTTRSGRKVELRVYCEPGKEDRCGWAMESLKRAMKWDEDRFGLEYDLDIFMIVAVSNFNMGAMENKGLNIFNDKLILASPDMATDREYEAIEAVIGHEYFHNWTGNRVTCRDWFQLCLKEGLTVFRDQEFTSDLRSRGVKRIEDVVTLRAQQFGEDSGPLAHPVRPDSFIEINNFYTRTVYDKGAELCGMIRTIVGEAGFRKGIDLYFERHDGTAATVEDFVAAMADANQADLSQFMLWYSQAGTPELTCRLTHSPEKRSARLTVRQALKPTPGQPKKKPMHIPLKLGLIDGDGKDLPLKLEDGGRIADGVLHLRKRSESFTFTGISDRPTASLLRGFSAPVNLTTNLGDRDLEFLIANDSDQFNRWQAAQTLAMKSLKQMTAAIRAGETPRASPRLAKALGQLIADEALEPAFRAFALTIPGFRDIALAIGDDIDPEAIYAARRALRQRLGKTLKSQLEAIYADYAVAAPYSPDAGPAGRRQLRNAALGLLTAAGGRAAVSRLREHYKQATNMTDSMAALESFGEVETPARDAALKSFYNRWKKDALVLDKWFSLQARSPIHGTAEFVAELRRHPQFSMKNPNRVRAVLAAFAMGNPVQFHARDGKGYRLIADAVLELNAFNALMAARLLNSFEMWRMLEPVRQAAAHRELERITTTKDLSRDVYEIAGKMLKEPEEPEPRSS